MASTVAMMSASFLVVFLATIAHSNSFSVKIQNVIANPGGDSTLQLRCGGAGYFISPTLADLFDTLKGGEYVAVTFWNDYHRYSQWYCYFSWGIKKADFVVWQLPESDPVVAFRKVDRIHWIVEAGGFYVKETYSTAPFEFIHPWGTTQRK